MKAQKSRDPYEPANGCQNMAEEDGSKNKKSPNRSNFSFRRSATENKRDDITPLSLNNSSVSLTNSAPTILVNTPDIASTIVVNTPDDDSFHRIHRPLRSSMTSRTLHESLHRGSRGGENNMSRSVSFANVNIREYERILGDNPSCTSGPPLSIGWRFAPKPISVSVDDFEEGKGDVPRASSEFLVPKAARERMLKEHADVSRRDVVAVVRTIQKQKSQRRKTVVNLGMQGTEEKVEKLRRSLQKVVLKTRKSYATEEKKLWDEAHERAVEKAKRLEDSIRNGENISMSHVYSVGKPVTILPSRTNSGDSIVAVEQNVNNQYLIEGEETKEEEEVPTASDHEVVSYQSRGAMATQEPGIEGNYQSSGDAVISSRSIVICEEDADDIFDKVMADGDDNLSATISA